MSCNRSQKEWFKCKARIGPLPAVYVKYASQGRGSQPEKIKAYLQGVNWRLSREQQLQELQNKAEGLGIGKQSQFMLKQMLIRGYDNMAQLAELQGQGLLQEVKLYG